MISVKYKDKELKVGDTIRAKTTVVEGNKTRIQTFEGVIISLRGRDSNKTMTVRRVGARNIGVERTWPLDSKSIVDIDVVKRARKVRRAKLYFLRNIVGKMSSAL
ncbi:MAG: 50S ribosomal protein L19 [Candidatus Daviesbacteria bacterium GW2011_GWA2_38_24]|uniref:50S ribosomal protein L19 n=1 Tax=Candidatus Daviesbacteria bacterium GW2011_GWA2_38_24 TaxID=1618422 RepID=A0A0G0JVJ7_9BACT|nr:MAG: 50S ribosomal protein L19 [Candidatus Daviesbacteria bacterium GW2011_GWA2_38_24]KKQ80952.1 MAG: 50S ribosomal protein L19 [Candidatus Daviesbacteria bacterium GW2011_GWA1_38_7]OGE22861.1 MAG: 50S ribosomal protein L19 [Candidatus Daviesbacteria bacterium RIFCSPHIGHO2_01_FULL_38_8]